MELLPQTAAVDIASSTTSFLGSFSGIATLIGGVLVGLWILSEVIDLFRNTKEDIGAGASEIDPAGSRIAHARQLYNTSESFRERVRARRAALDKRSTESEESSYADTAVAIGLGEE